MQRTSPSIIRRCTAEFIGTFGLVFAGAGAIMVDFTSGGEVTNLGIGIVFGLVVAAMIYATGHISGAHINPAVTLGFALARHFPWKWVPHYWSSQLMGASAAALVLRALFGDVANMGATLPSGGVWDSLLFEGVLTFFLMFVIMAVATDSRAVGSSAAIAVRSSFSSSARPPLRRAPCRARRRRTVYPAFSPVMPSASFPIRTSPNRCAACPVSMF